MVELSKHVESCSSTTKNISTNTAYDHQTWLCVDLPWRASTHEVAWLYNQVFLRNHVTLKPVYLHYHNTYGHQTL